MNAAFPRSTASIFGHPIHPMLVPFPIAGFLGVLICDLAYIGSENLFWLNMGAWLIAGGLLFGGVAAIFGLIDFIFGRDIRRLPAAWAHLILNVLLMIVQVFNLLIHSRDGWTAVVPAGLTLSIIGAVLLLASGWMGAAMVYRHRVGVRP